MSNFVYKILDDSDFLMHHGIKGQKWGIMNGPPYPLNDNVKAIAYRGGVLKDGSQIEGITKRDVANARKIINKNIKYMSTQDLNEYRNRLMLEGNLGDITGSNWAQKQGKKILDSLEKIGTQSAVNIGTKFATQAGMRGIAAIMEKAGMKNQDIKFFTNYGEGKDEETTESDNFWFTDEANKNSDEEFETSFNNSLLDLLKRY